MTVSKILCLNLFLLLSVHGLEVVARIRFQSAHYTVSEDSPRICVPVENMAPPTSSDFAVSFSFDSVLVGSQEEETQMAPSLQGSLRFRAGMSVSDLCFSHFDDQIACEPDIVGRVRLINSTAVVIIEPSVAIVTIKDDDPAFVGFKSSSYQYTEDQVISDSLHPIIKSSHPSLPITLHIREVQHSSMFVSSSLSVPDSSLSIDSTEEILALALNDDDVALEAPEVIILEASVTDHLCSSLQLSPYNQTLITIVDNDEVVIGLTESAVTVQERGRSAVVCVSINKRVARRLAFRLTTRDETAFSGEDYAASDLIGQFMPFSDQTEICYEIPITFDSVVEPTESFKVHFTMETQLPNEVRQKLSVSNAATKITVQDSSDCFRVVLDQTASSSPLYIPELSTVCFDCAAPSSDTVGGASDSVLWQLGSEQLRKNDLFSNGHVLSNGTLMITDSSKTFSFKEETMLACSNNMESELINFSIVLGAPPQIISLVSSEATDSSPQMLTCLFEGVPQPTVEWLLNDKPVQDDHHIHTDQAVSEDEPDRYRSVLTLPKEGVVKGVARYECLCRNQFGPSRSIITLTEQPVSEGVSGGSRMSPLSISVLTLLPLLLLLL